MSAYIPGSGSVGPTGPFDTPLARQTGRSTEPAIYHPTTPGDGTGSQGGVADPNAQAPGAISINPLNPVETAQQAVQSSQGMFDGLASQLFGPHTGLLTGGLTGAIADGTDPLSAAGRFVGGVPGGIGDAANNLGKGVGGLLERAPSPGTGEKQLDAMIQTPEMQKWLNEKADPNDPESPTNKQKYLDAGDHGILGSGLLSNEAHFKEVAAREYQKSQMVKNPSLFNGKFLPSATLADTIGDTMDLAFGWAGPLWNRGLAQVKDRAEQAREIGSGEAVSTGFLGTGFTAGSKEATPGEILVAQKLADGSWTKDQANDFLVASGQTAHDAGLSVALATATPDVAFGFGAGLAVKGGLKAAQGVKATEEAVRLAEEANAAHSAAEAAVAAARVTRAGKAAIKVGEQTRTMVKADKALEAAKATLGERQAAVDALKGYRVGDNIGRFNVVDKAFQGSEKARAFTNLMGQTYTGLEGTTLGRVSKLSRYILDPMHAIDLHMPGNAAMADVYADANTHTLHVTMNPIEGTKNFHMFDDMDATGGMLDRYSRALATAMTNRARSGLLLFHQQSSIDRGLAGALQAAEPGFRDQVIEDMQKVVKQRDLNAWLREDVVQNIARPEAYWNAATHEDLATRLEAVFGMRTKAEWLDELPTMSKERKSLLDLALYGESNKGIIEAVDHARAAGHASVDAFNLDRAVLVSKKTLNRVVASDALGKLTKKLEKRGGQRKALETIHGLQERYPELRVITMDEANPGKSIHRFTSYLEDHMESFPMILTKDELPQLTDEMQTLTQNLGNGYELGFRPKDEFLWGVERSNEAGGGFVGKANPWADHVGDGGRGFRPGHDLPKNIAGLPLIGTPLSKVAKEMDYLGAGASMLAQQVTGQQIHAVARMKFVSEASTGKYAGHGLTEAVASKWWDRLQEFTREHQGYSGPRGFGKGDLYKAIADEGLIPSTMLNGSMKLQPEDLLHLVLDAYDGDMRFIGLTQKLSGRAKKYISAATGYQTNFAGQIAEHAWPTAKFLYNPVFQTQEKIEPVVLNWLRGTGSPFLKPTMSAADAATEKLLARMSDNSIIRQADGLDQAEYTQLIGFDKAAKAAAATPGSNMERLSKAAGSIMDVQGVKRIGALRTFRRGMGKELKGAWEQAMPGVWDQMKVNADAMAGRVMDEDEFAIQIMAENLFANDINIGARLNKASKVAGLGQIEGWENSVKTGEWLRPSHVGELRTLDLDHVARSMQSFADGTKVSSMADLRRVIGTAEKPGKKLQEVSDFLARLGADKDYIGRVENSLTFSWTGFWNEAEKRYNMTFDESKRLQDFMGAAADVRGMTPIDFMSQVFDPGILDGMEGMLGSLDKPLGVLRANKLGETVGRGRSRLAAPIGGAATRDDLVKQISAVFSQHLDPSAKKALLMEFKPTLLRQMKADAKSGTGLRLDSEEVKAMWDSEAEDALAQRILGYMDGKYGTAEFDPLGPGRGIGSVQSGAERYLREHGVTPMDERRHYKTDDVHYQRVADEFSTLPEVDYERTMRRPTTKQVNTADSDLKPKPAGVSDRDYAAYQQFVHETQDQFGFMTRSKADGGMGIKVIVAKGDPYTQDAAGRIAMSKDIEKGQLRVKGTDSDHPLMTNEQNVQFRAVHDVFGHAANDFQFGPRGEMNAAAEHFKMYGPEARGPMLTETHGQTAYVNYSNDVIPGVAKSAPLDTANPVADFEARHPFEPEAPTGPLGPNDPAPDFRRFTLRGDNPTPTIEHIVTQRVGEGIRALPPELQLRMLQPLSNLMEEFPGLKVHHVDVADFAAPLDSIDDNMLGGLDITKMDPYAVTFGGSDNNPVIIFNSKWADPQFHGEDWLGQDRMNEFQRQYPSFTKDTPQGTKDVARESRFGAPWSAVGPDETLGIETVMRHEAGHAFDLARRPMRDHGNGIFKQVAALGQKDYHAMMSRFEKSDARLWLSEYGMASGPEFAADLFSFATSPRLDMAKVKAISPEFHDMIDEYQTYLKKTGEWVPTTPNPLAGKTVREANAAQRGSVFAPQKAGVLPQTTIDEFAQRYVGVGKHVESNPDVARVAQHFGAWSQKVLMNGLLDGDNAVHSGLLQDIAKMPIGDAAPYNYTEGMAHTIATQAMKNKWNDAYRLQYFKQSRSMLERSINHPMFGLYPASYMWGKLMPEIVQFLAQRPFGLRTGSALSASMHAQSTIALRREYDPEFDAFLEKMGHSQALSFAGYMLPTMPNDISASAPAWAKDIAQQGLDNAALVNSGQEPKDFNALNPATEVLKKFIPELTTVPWAARAIDELNGPNTPAEKLQKAVEDASASGPIKATELGTPLWYVMQELNAELSR